MSDILECAHLVKIYESSSGRVQAVRGVDLRLESGKVTAIAGPSGSGKSSLLRMLAGLDRPTAGTVTIGGVDLFRLGAGRRARVRAEIVTHVRQRPSDNLLAHLTAEQQLWRVARPRSLEQTRRALDRLGLRHCRDRLPGEMSGGERQRLAFARAVAANHVLVIADEPTSQLDSAAAATTLDAVRDMADGGLAILIATHDPRVLSQADDVIRLRDGAIESVTSGGAKLAVIDASGRLQLPVEVLAGFPERRAVVEWDPAAGTMTVRKP